MIAVPSKPEEERTPWDAISTPEEARAAATELIRYNPPNLAYWSDTEVATLLGMSPEAFGNSLSFYGPMPGDWPRGWHTQAQMNLTAAVAALIADKQNPTKERVITWLKTQKTTDTEEM